MAISMQAAVAAYRDGNNNGRGYAPYTDDAADDRIDTAVECATADGWILLLDRNTSDDVAVLRNDDGELMAIGGDACGRGAWAVIISDDSAMASAPTEREYAEIPEHER